MMIFAPSEAALEAAASPERQEPTPRMREHSAARGSRAAAYSVTGAIFHHRAREHTQHCRLRAGAAKRRGAERRGRRRGHGRAGAEWRAGHAARSQRRSP